jgi:hypothetical protein
MEAEGIAAEREGEDRGWLCGYPSTLANSTLINTIFRNVEIF